MRLADKGLSYLNRNIIHHVTIIHTRNRYQLLTREHVLDHFRIYTTTLFQLKSMSITFEFKSQFSSEPVFVMCMYFSNTECFLLHFVLIYHPKVSEIFKILIRINKWRHLNRYFKAWDNDNKNSDDILRVATFVILLILANVM